MNCWSGAIQQFDECHTKVVTLAAEAAIEKQKKSGQSIECDDLNAKRMAPLVQQVYHEFQTKRTKQNLYQLGTCYSI